MMVNLRIGSRAGRVVVDVRILDATKMVVRFPIPMLSFVKEFRVGSDRCVRPRVSAWTCFMDLYIDECTLARWMHRVRADAAGRYENTVCYSVRLG
jgi:hypothetical protein